MGERSKQGKGPKNSIYSLFNIGLKEKKNNLTILILVLLNLDMPCLKQTV